MTTIISKDGKKTERKEPSKLNRRDFFKAGVATSVGAAALSAPLVAAANEQHSDAVAHGAKARSM